MQWKSYSFHCIIIRTTKIKIINIACKNWAHFLKISFLKIKKIMNKSWSPSLKSIFIKKNQKDSTNFQHWKMTLKTRKFFIELYFHFFQVLPKSWCHWCYGNLNWDELQFCFCFLTLKATQLQKINEVKPQDSSGSVSAQFKRNRSLGVICETQTVAKPN